MVQEFKEDLFLLLTPLDHTKMITNSTIKVMLLQTIKVRLSQKIGENKTSTGVLMLIQQSTDFSNVIQFQLAPLLSAKLILMLIHQTMLLLFITGVKIMHTGMTHGLLPFTNVNQFQHAPLLDAILIPMLTHMTMQTPLQTGAIQTSTGNQIILHQLVRKTLFNVDQFQHALLLDVIKVLVHTHTTMPIPPQTGAIQTNTGNQIILHQLVRKTLSNSNLSLFQHAPPSSAKLELLPNHSAARSQMDTRLTTSFQISELIKKWSLMPATSLRLRKTLDHGTTSQLLLLGN
jgi:hypothetical protein